jgi:6-phosphogluconolactonase
MSSLVNAQRGFPNIEILSDKSAITSRALAIVLELYQQAIAARDQFTFVAAGGSTPKLLYEALAEQQLDWQKIHIFWGDERYVPLTDPQSNQGMTRAAWLDRVAIPANNIHPMPTDQLNPAIAAQSYESDLQKFFEIAPGQFPSFDLVLLGIGDDGHTASLFPHTKALAVSDRLITVGEKDGQPRITFTYRLINHARQILFLVDGDAKKTAFKQIVTESSSTDQYPAKLIAGNVTWLVSESVTAENI